MPCTNLVNARNIAAERRRFYGVGSFASRTISWAAFPKWAAPEAKSAPAKEKAAGERKANNDEVFIGEMDFFAAPARVLEPVLENFY